MRLAELVGALAGTGARPLSEGEGAIEISGLAYDSRAVGPGELFLCVSGFTTDGHDFALQAIAKGAAALVVERPLALGLPELVLPSVRVAMAPLAARFYGEPSHELKVVGVTGTNGKTTTAYLTRALIEAGGRQCGLLGTITSIVGGQERPVQRTTPEAIELQRELRAMLDGGDRACAIEVSSHALELGRTDSISFAAAIFTNLTQDHLDFHDTMEDYFIAKRRLFLPPQGEPPAASIVNVGDPYGRRLAAEIEGVLSYAVEAPADYSATALECGFDGCRFTLHTPTSERRLSLALPGRFNVANALAALAAAETLGVELDAILAALERGVRVPGRFEPVECGQDFAVLVDYAHTPDSLENVLHAAAELAGTSSGHAGRVICVFGAGGDRDRGKRPMMGEIAARLADLVLVTSDNPRSEEPEQIIAEIMAGAAGAANVRAIEDRRAAIAQGVACAHSGDVVVIAGKGHEQGQELAGGHKVPFDDVSVAREALGAAVAGAAGARS